MYVCPKRLDPSQNINIHTTLVRNSAANPHVCILIVFICSLKFLVGDAAS